MNFYVSSTGQILHVDPENVYQGSVNANTIYFIGAFPSTCPVTVAFKTPDGVWKTPAEMNTSSELSGVQQADGTQYNTWSYTIPGTVTEYYGTVNLQFFVYAQGGSGSGNVLATDSSSFEVKRGVPVTLPEPTDDYTTLLTQILSALQQLQQADSEGALAAQQSATAAAASATQAAQSATNAESAQTAAEAAQTAAETAQEAAETAQAAAEAAQAGAEEAEQNAQTLVNNAQDIAETTASGIVNNLLQNGGTFEGPVNFNGSVNIKETLIFGDQSTQAGAQIDYGETGMSYDSIEQGENLSGKTLLFNTGTDVSSSGVDWGDPQSALTLMTFGNGASLVVGGDEPETEYAFYLLYNGQTIYIVQNGAWVKNEYVLAGSGWTVSSVTSYDSLVTDAQRAIAESFISQAYLNMPLSRFDDGAKSEYMAEANDDLTNKQYVDGQVAAEATARQNADNALQNSKYDKTGGTIGGDVQITGDLTVNGTTTTNDAETLQVKDNYIVTNSDGATLAGYSGIIIRTNSTVTYGITYDPIRNAVLLGQGVYNAVNGTFSFNSGEGLPVAVRAVSPSWTNGDIAVWDSTNNQFVDGGKSLSDLQEALTFDNVPTQGSGNPVTSGGIYTALQDYVTSESLITVLSSYATLSGNNTFTGNNTFSFGLNVTGSNPMGYIVIGNGPYTIYDINNITREANMETYTYSFPNESGTFAMTSDIDNALEPVQESISDLTQSVNDIYTILQQEVYTSQDITQEYTSRETADGADIIDGALATLKTVQGATVATTNLIPYPYYDGTSKTVNGVTFTVNDDRSITANGTATGGNAAFYISSSVFFSISSAGFLSGCPSGGSGSTYNLQIYNSSYYFDNGSGVSVPVGSYTIVAVIFEGYTANNLKFYPMLNTGSSALPYMPYFTGLKNAYFQGLKSTGRNLLKLNDGEYNVVGVNVNISNGIIKFSGTSSGSGGRTQWISDGFVLKAGTYFLTCSPALDPSKCVGYLSNYDTFSTVASTLTGVFTLDTDTKVGFGFNFLSVGNEYSGSYTIMLNRGDSALPYEQYTSNELSLPAPIELAEWDTLDFVNNQKNVQSNTLTFDGTESWSLYPTEEPASTYTFLVTFNNVGAPFAFSNQNVINNYTTSDTSNPFCIRATGLTASGLTTLSAVFNKTYYPNMSTVSAWKAQLSAWNAAGNPLTVCYQTANVTATPLNDTENRYTAYNSGSETVIQGTTDNSEYGAENTLTQNYAEVKGGTQA